MIEAGFAIQQHAAAHLKMSCGSPVQENDVINTDGLIHAAVSKALHLYAQR